MAKVEKKTLAIGILSFTAGILATLNLVTPRTASGVQAIKDRDYSAVTAHVTQGGDALYLTDNRTGTTVVFNYDPNKRALVPLDKRSLMDAFVVNGRGR